jgi:FkbM family methyltransferase
MSNFLRGIVPPRYRYRLAELWRRVRGYERYSQFGEDEVLLELCKDTQNGFYVDVGAHHPQRYSNTYLLHARGWHGINIDADPRAIALFKTARPHDVNVHTGIGATKGELEYYRFSDSAVNTFVKEEAERWMHKDWLTFLGTVTVPIRTLGDVLAEYAPNQTIDLLTIDIEGMGLDALRSLDWEVHRPRIIAVEGEIGDFLTQKGYRLYREVELTHIYIDDSAPL